MKPVKWTQPTDFKKAARYRAAGAVLGVLIFACQLGMCGWEVAKFYRNGGERPSFTVPF